MKMYFTLTLSYLLLYISELIDSFAVTAGGDAVSAAAAVSFLQGLYGLCVDYTQKVIFFQRNSLFLLNIRVVCGTIQLNNV